MLNKIRDIKFSNLLFLVTILFFLMSIINVVFALVGLVCMILPFVLYYRTKQKVWCKYYCPRANLFSRVLRKISLGLKVPKWLTSKRAKMFVVIYFGINAFFITISSIMVFLGRREALDFVRFLIVFKAPFTLPQLFTWSVHPALLHLGYRVFSMFFSSITIGLILGILFKPRTWCAVCPVSTLTTQSKKIKTNSSELKNKELLQMTTD